MALRHISLIPLIDAFLCSDMDCQAISNVSYCCPVCGSQVQSLSKVLNRTTDNEGLWALKGLLARHNDGTDERYWAEWDTAQDALERKRA